MVIKPFELSETSQAAITNDIGGMASSVVSQAVYTPIDVVSQKLIRSEGFKGLYIGFTLPVITYSPSSVVWWATYGLSQRFLWRFLEDDVKSEEATPSLPKIVLVQARGGIIAGEALFQTHKNLEHIAMMERVLSPLPMHMLKKVDRHAEKYARRGKLDWPVGAT